MPLNLFTRPSMHYRKRFEKLSTAPPSAESIDDHLESCSDCRRRVAELSSDRFLERLRDAQVRFDLPAPIMSSADGLTMRARGARFAGTAFGQHVATGVL